ncbi:phosphatidate cytidylyltransferase [Savagea sp. SN6]|uniref:Phosphatidate cytidylyltransferase n=1 Tax=Savagea serpentis TaxID=2785297 RepID=A0A8J7KRX0_9BACL|nr:phosphatidate cytidylyltransferase [Savagea serpentis]MBF4499974.1 phosphatidate cytidylyltransferase [Savagea serpentis]
MKQRIITAIIAFGIFIPFIFIGGLPLTLIIYAIASIGLFEMLRMRELSIFSIEGILSWIALALLLLPSQYVAQLEQWTTLSIVEMIFIIVFLLLIVTVISKNRITFDHVGFIILSFLYVGIGFHYFIETRTFGVEYIFYALLIVWTTDSGAYFIGRKVGKRKLWPEISPNKTVEGFWGGVLSAVVMVLIYQQFFTIHPSFVTVLIVTIVASMFGQLGDLVESALKRHYNVKDSGTLLPGHGGVMDRFDSLLFVLPLLHFLHLIG